MLTSTLLLIGLRDVVWCSRLVSCHPIARNHLHPLGKDFCPAACSPPAVTTKDAVSHPKTFVLSSTLDSRYALHRLPSKDLRNRPICYYLASDTAASRRPKPLNARQRILKAFGM